jgi:hypothetical protein
VDFGFPAMMVPVLLIAVMVGAQASLWWLSDASTFYSARNGAP